MPSEQGTAPPFYEIVLFVFQGTLPEEMEILIEDNQHEILIEEELEEGQSSIQFSLTSNEFVSKLAIG